MHGHIWGSLLAAPLLNNNHLPFHSALIVSNSLWQIVADKPPAPPPSVTPTQSPHLYRLSFLIFDFAFKVMCFSPMMKSVLKPNAEWSATLLFHTLSYSASSTRSCSASPFSSFFFSEAFSPGDNGKQRWLKCHTRSYRFVVTIFVCPDKFSHWRHCLWGRQQTLLDDGMLRQRLTKVWSEHSIQQLFNIGPRHTGLWVSTGPLLIDPPLQPCIRNMYIQYRPGARSLKKWMDTSTGRWMAYSEKSIHLFNKSTTWVWLKISNLVSQFSDGSSSAVLRDFLMQFNFFVMSTMNGKEKQRQRNRSTG